MKLLATILAFASIGAFMVAGCGDDDDDSGSGGTKSVHLVTSSTGQAYVGQFHAAGVVVNQLGLAKDNQLTEFEDETAAAQVLVAGRADVESSGMTQLIQLIDKGQKVK